jgi:DNA-binding CsgD family transcriptional regulator
MEKTARYRKIGKYVKSIGQYKRERERRKIVFQLYSKGYTQKQIAEQIGVSPKTVYRDLKKLHSWFKRLEEKSKQDFFNYLTEKLHAYPLNIQFLFVTDMMLAEGNPKLQDKLLSAMLKGKYEHREAKEDE